MICNKRFESRATGGELGEAHLYGVTVLNKTGWKDKKTERSCFFTQTIEQPMMNILKNLTNMLETEKL